MKSVHKRLVVSWAIALALVSLSAERPALDKKEALALRKITEYWREGNFRNAQTQILDYLSNYPESEYINELYAMLGDLYFQEKNYDAALATYDKISSRACKECTSLRKMETLFILGRYDELIDWSQKYPIRKESSEENYQRYSLLRAESLYRIAIETKIAEEQKAMAAKALEAYRQVPLDTSHHIELAIAHLFALTGDVDQASQQYLRLAGLIPEKQEELLFRAATLLTNSDPAQSLDIFQKVIARQGDFLSSALFNRLTLLYRQKNYTQFIAEYERNNSALNEEQNGSLLFCRCIALFHMDRYTESVAPLQALIQTDRLSNLQTRQALLSLFFCAQKTNDLELINTALPLWSARLLLDEGYLRGLFAKAQIALGKKEAAVACETLREILERFPACEERETVLFHYAQSLALTQNWATAREMFQKFLEEFAASPSRPLAWQHLIFCSSQLLKESSSTSDKEALKACLVLDLKYALSSNPPLDGETARVYRRAAAQLCFELGQHREALAFAEEYLRSYPEDLDKQSMRLLAVACYAALHSPAEILIALAEEALVHETDSAIQARIRLQLFNAYLSSAGEAPDALAHAAEHLLTVYQTKGAPIKRENLLWLADYILTKNGSEFGKMSIEILEEALQFDGKQFAKADDLDSSLLEGYALRLSSLYEQQMQAEKSHTLLSALVQFADANAGASWQQRRHVIFSLAQTKEKLGQTAEALSLYSRLIDDAAFASSSYYRRAAILRRAQLQYASLPLEEKKGETPVVLAVLDTLKELQITKNIHSEPIHLEAALEYALIRSSSEDRDEQVTKFLFYLEKMIITSGRKIADSRFGPIYFCLPLGREKVNPFQGDNRLSFFLFNSFFF